MEDLRFNRLTVAVLLSAYLVTGILSPTVLLGQALFFLKLDNSISVRNDRSIALDERPYWTSHKHLISPEQFSNDHILSVTGPWISVIAPKRLHSKSRQHFFHAASSLSPKRSSRTTAFVVSETHLKHHCNLPVGKSFPAERNIHSHSF